MVTNHKDKYRCHLLYYEYQFPFLAAVHDKEETNSVVVHTSVDGASLGSEVGIKGEERERLELPQEPESLHDSVRRLQLSVQEHCPEQIKLEV